jgi:hypothetical protein
MKDRLVYRPGTAAPKAIWRAGYLALALAATMGFSPVSRAADAGNWVGSWAASPQPVWTSDFAVPIGVPGNLWKQTIRQTARLSIGGNRVRVVFSNEYGNAPLAIGAAGIALAADAGKIKDGSEHPITFGGSPSIVIPPGAPAISDPVDMSVDPLALVSVSIYLPQISPLTTVHTGIRLPTSAPETKSPTSTSRPLRK